jgi:hypothetical protein
MSFSIQHHKPAWDYDLARLVVLFVASHVPGEQTIQPWLTQRRLLQHVARCSYMILSSLVADDGIASACYNLTDCRDAAST